MLIKKAAVITRLFTIVTLVACAGISAQSKADDIPVSDLPAAVKAVIEQYAAMLHESKSVEECAAKFGAIAGGSLIDDNGTTPTRSTVQFGLKKDFNNMKHYTYPVVITRVNKTATNGEGYGANKIAGDRYKVWIAKSDPKKGMPAPVTVIVPQGHATITTPKIVNVGSF